VSADHALSESIVKLIDHAVLQATQTAAEVRAACEFCAALGVASVCVKPSYVPLAVECLAGSGVSASTVIGFPHGGAAREIKAAETHLACQL
jgi:deoxyribose-phosphate aldolase